MEQTLHPTEAYDFRKYDRIWQRVAPNLEPYPDLREPAAPAVAPLDAPVPAEDAAPAVPAPAAPDPAVETLPGAEPDSCCMGTAAQEELGVIEGFIELELGDRRAYLALARQAPASARGTVRDLAAASAAAARRLMTAYYLITGTCYRPAVSGGSVRTGAWCPALRERYHAAACNGMNYLRAGEETTDPCLKRLLTELGEGAYRQADRLLALLERAL